MMRLLKLCRGVCSVKLRRVVARTVAINLIVLIALSAVAFNVLHFTNHPPRERLKVELSHIPIYPSNSSKSTHGTKTSKNPIALFSIPPVPRKSETDFVPPIQRSIIDEYLKYEPRDYEDTVVILTPIHNVARILKRFGDLLKSLTYPHELISVAFGEDCSHDGTLTAAREIANDLRTTFKQVDVIHFNITGALDGHWSEIHKKQKQLHRRGHLAMARNLLMNAALKNVTWALWIDSDVSYLPPDIIQQLLSSGKDIVVPACLYNSDGRLRVFDKNTWRETNESLAYLKTMRSHDLMLEGYGPSRRIYLTDLRAEGRVVPIDGVGGCTLLIKGDHHRKGLIFPESVVDHHIETEGLGKKAKKMGLGVFGMPFVEVMH